MVPVYALISAWAALILAFDPQGRVAASPGLTAARYVVHGQMWLWGVVFLALAVAIGHPFRTCVRRQLVLALYAGAAVLGMWAVFTAAAVLLSAVASLMAPAWLAALAAACWASARSVLVREGAR